jgi:hypothetical protein
MTKVLNLAEKQDSEGVWHQVRQDVCHWCGCNYLLADDDHDLVWEPGAHHEGRCSDELCECHEQPAVGTRRD